MGPQAATFEWSRCVAGNCVAGRRVAKFIQCAGAGAGADNKLTTRARQAPARPLGRPFLSRRSIGRRARLRNSAERISSRRK